MVAKQNTSEETRSFAKVNAIIEAHGKRPEALIAILQEIQEEYRYLPEEVLAYVATALNISPAKVYGVTTFYAQFSTVPKGKYVIQVCDGTACHVRGSNPLIETIEKTLNVSEDKPTSDDLLFTLETVSCLGACGLAPVMLINDKVFGEMTPESTKELLEKLKSGEVALDD